MNFRNLMKKLEKIQNYLTNSKIDSYHGNVKTDGNAIDISKFPERMKEQLLKVLAP